MRAIIHKGDSGKHYRTLCRAYETDDFYGLIVESVMNGHRDQAIEYFNMLGGPWQYAFMSGGYMDYGYYGEEAYRIILKAIWMK